MRRSRTSLSVRVTLVSAVICVSCSSLLAQTDEQPGQTAAQAEAAPGLSAATDRAVLVTTTGCGFAPEAVGSGIAISPTQVLTVAHVVAGSEDISLAPVPADAQLPEEDTATGQQREGPEREGTVVAYDTLRDLALIEITGGQPFEVLELAKPTVLADGDNGLIVGAATSGDVPFTVSNKTGIETKEIRGSRRSRRSGYMIDARTDSGDSGSGLYDGAGNLAGLLFAVSTVDGQRSWATAGDEIQAFLDDSSVAGNFECDPERSKLKIGE